MRFCLFVLVIFGISANVASGQQANFRAVKCDGFYEAHLQGICTNDEDAIFWSFTVALIKTDRQGKIQKKIPVKNHHGDLCYANGKIYVATNLGRFNDRRGNADNWVYEYNATDFSFVKRYRVAEVFHGAGGIAYHKGRFFVVGGLPKGVQQNYVYEYDQRFKFTKKHVIKSGYTLLGIQTATFANGYFWFGCYGKKLLKTDISFKLVGKYDFDCGLGLVGIPGKRFLSASGTRIRGKGHTGTVSVAVPHEKKGLVIRNAANNSKTSRRTDWPCWRGPEDRGVADGRNLPVRWSRIKNILWSVRLPGCGTSSPVDYGHRVFAVFAIGLKDAEVFVDGAGRRRDFDTANVHGVIVSRHAFASSREQLQNNPN